MAPTPAASAIVLMKASCAPGANPAYEKEKRYPTTMKLYYSPLSPFARKCLVFAHELGLRDRVEPVVAAAHPVNRDRALIAFNPLGKVPTLVTEKGVSLYDSRVICEYLNDLGDGHLIPAGNPDRWVALVEQSLADGLMDAAVLTRYEMAVRPEALRWNEWSAGQLDKITCAMAELEGRAPSFKNRIDIGTIAVGCALGYLDFRFESLGWREKYPAVAAWFNIFAARESMVATRPAA
jgi:glutathione S-transferase